MRPRGRWRIPVLVKREHAPMLGNRRRLDAGQSGVPLNEPCWSRRHPNKALEHQAVERALPSHGRGRRFDPCIAHHPVPANRPGFPGNKNYRNSGRLASRSASANRIPVVLPWSAPNITGQSLPEKFRFPGCTMEAVGPKQRAPNICQQAVEDSVDQPSSART